MSEFALSTNLWTFIQVDLGYFSWPEATGEAEVIAGLQIGDLIVPKFSKTPTWDTSSEGMVAVKAYCEAVGADFDQELARYEQTISGGARAIPYLLRVAGSVSTDTSYSSSPAWASIPVEEVDLKEPLSTREFLLLRALPVQIAAQFKGTVAPGRHLQELPDGTAAAVIEATQSADGKGEFLRQYSLVEGATATSALAVLKEGNRAGRKGDRAFVASPAALLGVHEFDAQGDLVPVGPPIPRTPDDLLDVFQMATARANSQDQFTPQRAVAALREIRDLLEGPSNLVEVDDFSQFHDRYNLLASKVTQALEISKRPISSSTPEASEDVGSDDEAAGAEIDELAALGGLTVDAVRAALPEGMRISDEVLADAVTAIRAGNHLLLSGPPGTGKTTLAEAICAAVVGSQYDVSTATADWTTFDTIGGYMPTQEGSLEFEPGIVLRSLQRSRWLVIDELNRADIDKAFGPMFTLLSGAGSTDRTRRVVLPYHSGGRSIEVHWVEKRTGGTPHYEMTAGWRLLGTLNVSDKAALFQLSFAFLRRFALIDIPLPERAAYEDFFRERCANLSEENRDQIVLSGIELAFGPRPLGPAILKDIATFMTKGLAETASGQPTFEGDVQAFLSAVRLYAVPQYEGATQAESARALSILQGPFPHLGEGAWQPLREAFESVSLS